MTIHPSQIADVSDLDAQLQSLTNKQRRCVLAILHSSDGPLSVTDLATKVAAKEADDTALSTTENGTITLRQRHTDLADQLKILLHHQHLPHLADADLVEYDSEEKKVALATSRDETGTLQERLVLQND